MVETIPLSQWVENSAATEWRWNLNFATSPRIRLVHSSATTLAPFVTRSHRRELTWNRQQRQWHLYRHPYRGVSPTAPWLHLPTSTCLTWTTSATIRDPSRSSALIRSTSAFAIRIVAAASCRPLVDMLRVRQSRDTTTWDKLMRQIACRASSSYSCIILLFLLSSLLVADCCWYLKRLHIVFVYCCLLLHSCIVICICSLYLIM